MEALLIPAYLLVSAVAMSFVEWATHRHLMHRRRLPGFLYTVLPCLKTVFANHTLLHHGRAYHVFDHEPDPRLRWVNLRLDVWLSVLLVAPVCLLLWLASPIAAGCLLAVVWSHALVWNVIHTEMHVPAGRFFRTWRVYQFLRGYHQTHHHFPGCNFNIVFPLADRLLGTYRAPTLP